MASSHYDSPKRQACRTVSFICLTLLIYLIAIVFNFWFVRRWTTFYEYDSNSFEIVLTGCDLALESGNKREFEIRGLMTHVKQELTQDSGKVRILNVLNSLGCNGEPRMDCKRVCQVIVKVPSDSPPNRLWISQGVDDTADHVVVEADSVTLNKFVLRGAGGNWWDPAGPSIELKMSGSTVSGDFLVSLKKGRAWVRNSNFTGKIDIRSDNSVIAEDMPADQPTSLRWRQPNNYMCSMAGDSQLVLPDPNGAFGLCDSAFYKSGFQTFYDTSKDFFLDRAEFGAQLLKLPYCCGGSCPHASWCDGILFNVFPFGQALDGTSSASFSARAEILTANAVFENLKSLNLSGMVPYCAREALIQKALVRTRTIEGWPAFAPATNTPAPSPTVVWSPCYRHSDCASSYCRSTGINTGICDKHPDVSTRADYTSWTTCDKPCGGGQQIRQVVCLGSDGLTYPNSYCTSVSSPVEISSVACNTHACELPSAVTMASWNEDMDLRANFIDIQVLAALPMAATSIQARLGSAKGAMLTEVVGEVSEGAGSCVSDTSQASCTLRVQAYIPPYVDRILLTGINQSGQGPNTTIMFEDRIGEVEANSLSPRQVTLMSEAGAVYFSAQGTNTAATWAPENRLKDIRMYRPDALRLMQDVAPLYGDTNSQGHGYVVIDTLPSPGIPQTRWIYTTRPVWAVLDPAHLTFLSGGLLMPTMHNFRIGFVDSSCDQSAYQTIPQSPSSKDFENKTVQARLEQMHRQIEKSLRSNGLSTARIRGQLYLVDPNFRQKPDAGYKLWVFEESVSASGEISLQMLARPHGVLDEVMNTAVALSLAVGLIVSFFGIATFYKQAGKTLDSVEAEKRANKGLLASKLGIKQEDQEASMPETRGNPFRQPIVLIDVLVMEPVRKRLFNSLYRFTQERLKVEERHARFSKTQVVPIAPAKGAAGTDLESGAASKKAYNPNRFLYLRKFRAEYEMYCIDKGLEPISSRAEIVRSLIDWYDVRTVRETVWRMRGVRWKPATGATKDSDATSEHDDSENALLQFCREKILVTGNMQEHWLDCKDRRLPSGQLQRGIRKAFEDYCEENGVEPVEPELFDPLSDPSSEEGLAYFAADLGVSFQEAEIQKIIGVSLSDDIQLTPSWKMILFDFILVCVHMLCLMAPAFVLIILAMDSQSVFAKTLSMEDPIQSMDVLGVAGPYIGLNPGSRHATFTCAIVMSTQFLYILFAILRVLAHYILKETKVKWTYDMIFSVILLCELAAVFAFAGCVGAWCILATILDPTRFLPYGTGVVVVIVVISSLWNESQAIAKALRGKIQAAVEAKLQGSLQSLSKAMQQKMHEQAIQSLKLRKADGLKKKTNKKPPKKVDETEAGFGEFKEAKQRKIAAADIFDMLDRDGGGTLSFAEFKELFKQMDSKISQQQLDKLFAYCDTDGSGSVTLQEFEEAWDYMVRSMVEKAVWDMGFSPVDIIIGIVLACILLGLLLAFIFLAMQGYYNESSFQSLVQAAMVSGSGKVVTVLRKRAPPKDADVNSLMADMGENEAEGEAEAAEAAEGGGEGG